MGPRDLEDLSPCSGCGARFRASDGPTHRYIGASAGCWALFLAVSTGHEPDDEMLEFSLVDPYAPSEGPTSPLPPVDALLGDAYAVQHHGDASSQAIQSVAIHLLTLHGIIARGVKRASALWVRRRTLRTRGVFQKLEPPPVGSALTIRHLFTGGGVVEPHGRSAYVVSVYDAWMGLHKPTVEQWYERFVD